MGKRIHEALTCAGIADKRLLANGHGRSLGALASWDPTRRWIWTKICRSSNSASFQPGRSGSHRGLDQRPAPSGRSPRRRAAVAAQNHARLLTLPCSGECPDSPAFNMEAAVQVAMPITSTAVRWKMTISAQSMTSTLGSVTRGQAHIGERSFERVCTCTSVSTAHSSRRTWPGCRLVRRVLEAFCMPSPRSPTGMRNSHASRPTPPATYYEVGIGSHARCPRRSQTGQALRDADDA